MVLMGTYRAESQLEVSVKINLTREDLANIIGTATETTIRILREFKEDGLIKIKGRIISILDPEKLIAIAREN